METSLDCLWELLREPVFDVCVIDKNTEDSNKSSLCKAEEAEKSARYIEVFFDKLEDAISSTNTRIPMPQHLQIFKEALKDFQTKFVEGVRKGASDAKAKAQDCNLCAVCRRCAEKFYEEIVSDNITERILPTALENYFLLPPQMHYYQNGLLVAKERRNLNNKFLCLKGFSSSTPTIHSATFGSDCTGGGLYINYHGCGIVVDPGIGFVNSMHKHGIFITDIDLVIITHDHLDHNSDATVLSSLLYDYNRYSQKKRKIVQEIFDIKKAEAHEIVWIVDGGSKSKLSNQVEKLIHLEEYLGMTKPVLDKNKGIELSAIRTEHIKGNLETYGIKLSLEYGEKTIVFGYTSDTGYISGLKDFFKDANLLVFNVSDIYKKDVKGIKDKHSHLGYNGSLKLLKGVNECLSIASEFCCTNGDFRVSFINVLKEEIADKHECKVFPGEIGLSIELPSLQIECSICKHKVLAKNVSIVAPKREYGEIQYICGNCL